MFQKWKQMKKSTIVDEHWSLLLLEIPRARALNKNFPIHTVLRNFALFLLPSRGKIMHKHLKKVSFCRNYFLLISFNCDAVIYHFFLEIDDLFSLQFHFVSDGFNHCFQTWASIHLEYFLIWFAQTFILVQHSLELKYFEGRAKTHTKTAQNWKFSTVTVPISTKRYTHDRAKL